MSRKIKNNGLVKSRKAKVLQLETRSRNGQRYLFIRHLCLLRGLRIKDLYNRFRLSCLKNNSVSCHYSVFHRVCQGQRKSARIRRWIAQTLKERIVDLWN